MLTKHHKYLQRRWMLGKINLAAAARKMGYKGASLTKGIHKVKGLLAEMGIAVF